MHNWCGCRNSWPDPPPRASRSWMEVIRTWLFHCSSSPFALWPFLVASSFGCSAAGLLRLLNIQGAEKSSAASYMAAQARFCIYIYIFLPYLSPYHPMRGRLMDDYPGAFVRWHYYGTDSRRVLGGRSLEAQMRRSRNIQLPTSTQLISSKKVACGMHVNYILIVKRLTIWRKILLGWQARTSSWHVLSWGKSSFTSSASQWELAGHSEVWCAVFVGRNGWHGFSIRVSAQDVSHGWVESCVLGGQSNEEETSTARQVCEDLWRSWQIESWPEQDCRQATTKSNKRLPHVHSE